MKEHLFFGASEDALAMISREYDLIHPLRASLKFTRREVAGLSDISKAQEMIDPLGEIHGVNYRKVFVEDTWEKQEEDLAWILLNSLLAIYEGWASEIFSIFEGADFSKEISFTQKLESADLSTKFGSYFITPTLQSTLIDTAMQNKYIVENNLDIGKLDKYMLMYRYFKELRNCYMHHNGKATDRVVNAYDEYKKAVTCKNDIDAEELPEIVEPKLGDKVKITIRGVIGFSQFLRRIIIISDIMLMTSKYAEQELITKKLDSNWIPCRLSGTRADQEKRIGEYFRKIGVHLPDNRYAFKEIFICQGIFKRA